MTDIILCTYNGEKYLREQIDSILSQDCDDFILDIVDDNSLDGTKLIIEEYVRKYPGKVKATYRSVGTGSACRNFLMAIRDAESYDYYMLSDQDDVWYSDKLSVMLGRMKREESNPLEPLLFQCGSKVVSADLEEISPSFCRYSGLNMQKSTFASSLLENTVVGGAVMFNRALKELITVIPAQAAMHDHWLFLCAKAFGRTVYIEKPLYEYRQHGDNVIGAVQGGFIKKVKNRLGFSDRTKREMDAVVRDNYRRMCAQAEEFEQVYGQRLCSEQKEILAAFRKLGNSGRIRKAFLTVKYGFYYSKWYQTVGNLILG